MLPVFLADTGVAVTEPAILPVMFVGVKGTVFSSKVPVAVPDV